jgi:hypothetical protein
VELVGRYFLSKCHTTRALEGANSDHSHHCSGFLFVHIKDLGHGDPVMAGKKHHCWVSKNGGYNRKMKGTLFSYWASLFRFGVSFTSLIYQWMLSFFYLLIKDSCMVVMYVGCMYVLMLSFFYLLLFISSFFYH